VVSTPVLLWYLIAVVLGFAGGALAAMLLTLGVLLGYPRRTDPTRETDR